MAAAPASRPSRAAPVSDAPAAGRRGAVDRLFAPVDAATLGTFRICFGAILAFEAWRVLSQDRVYRDYVLPRLTFPYEMLPFVAPWPEPFMTLHFAVMGASAAAMALGLWYRAAAAAFFATFTWAFLIDKTHYNNHSYLIAILGLLLVLVRAERWASIDAWRRGGAQTAPFWNLLLLRAQIAVVYVYGGIAKLNPDWLAGEPMRTWLAERSQRPVVGPLLGTEAAVWLFTWGGLLLDLLIVPLLLLRRTRLLAVVLLVLFHLTNSAMFSIGIFPYLMLAATVLFAEPDWPRRVLARLRRLAGLAEHAGAAPSPVRQPTADGDAATAARTAVPTPLQRALVVGFLAVWLGLQVVVPLRHWLYPGEVSWTEEGHRFAWHMKLRTKRGRVTLLVTDPRSGRTWKVHPGEELTRAQLRKMVQRPDMLLQYAHHVRDRLAAGGIASPIVRADAWVSLNRRPFQRIVAPETDLAAEPVRILAPAPWILPLEPESRPGTLGIDEGRTGQLRRFPSPGVTPGPNARVRRKR